MSELINLQVTPGGPKADGISSGTNLIIPPRTAASRLAHFPDAVYDLSPESHLVRLIKVLIGDAGAGQLRKRMMQYRLQQNISGIHFFDLDKFYGALFGVRRSVDEILDFDPYSTNATSAQWSIQHAKDASYRSRIVQFARAITYGPTPTGIELASEALLSIDVDVFESFANDHFGLRTYRSLDEEFGPGTGGYDLMDGQTYEYLEGEGYQRLAGEELREFVVRPKRPIEVSEEHALQRVLRKIKPADSRFRIESMGSSPYREIKVRKHYADSSFWEVIPEVASKDVIGDPYDRPSNTPVEQPRPPFAAYQGEAWSHIGDVIGISATYGETTDPKDLYGTVPQRITLPDGTYLDYPAHMALVPRRHLLAGRAVSDGVLTANPYWASSPNNTPDLSPLFTDRVSLQKLNAAIASSPIDSLPQNPIERFWVSEERLSSDKTFEVIDISLSQARRINYFSVETARYPHTIRALAFINDQWEEIGRATISDSIPAYLPKGMQVVGNPQHMHAGHWNRFSVNLTKEIETSAIRVTMQRIDGLTPKDQDGVEVPYSMALRTLDVGYRVRSIDDIPQDSLDGSLPIGSTLDPIGSRVEFKFSQQSADNIGVKNKAWRSDPQPVNYSVVNLYVDIRAASGDSSVFDTIYLDPLYSGASMAVYTTEDLGDPDGPEWYEDRLWRPVDRDYRVHKGYVHTPPTAARHIKLEFTALSAEAFSTMIPINRKVRLFPTWLVSEFYQTGVMDSGALPSGVSSAMVIGDDRRYNDALSTLREDSKDRSRYLETESLYTSDTQIMDAMQKDSWALGFSPWHQGSYSPRFKNISTHEYEVIEMTHNSELGFFVGIKDLKILRTDPRVDDDTLLYDEMFQDFRNIQPGSTWTFNPGSIETVLRNDCQATSIAHASRHGVWGIQFATQQTEPVQIIPDDDLRDPALATIDWSNNPDGWHRTGDATVVYSPLNHSARMARFSQPAMRPTGSTPGPVREVHHETFSYRPFLRDDQGQTDASFGGIESTLVSVSGAGDVYAAVRVTLLSQLTSPLLLEVVRASDGAVIYSHEITGNKGDVIEAWNPFPVHAPEVVTARLIQRGISDDLWEVDQLSLFDPGIKWEFSVDAGATWVHARDVRNDVNGFVTFPTPGTHLVWRATGLRSRMSISSLRIRPHYIGVQNARFNGVQRGPNVSAYDAGIAIEEDPLFTSRQGPIPREWFLAYRRFPTLVSVEGPTITEFARFYGRPVDVLIPDPTDVASRKFYPFRKAASLAWATPTLPIGVEVDRQLKMSRSVNGGKVSASDFATAFIIPKSSYGPWNIVVHKP